MTKTLREIIKKYGNKAINDNIYIFPVLSGINREIESHRLIGQKVHYINDTLKKIAKAEGFERSLSNSISTYYARHSYATILKNAGESISFIKESLGHESASTTEKYLSSFDIEHRKKTSENLDKLIVNL